MIIFDSFYLIAGNQYIKSPESAREKEMPEKICFFFSDLLYLSRTQYTQTGNWHIGKCKYWKYVVNVEISKLMYVEDIYW